jgi:signal transduction histidine kinase
MLRQIEPSTAIEQNNHYYRNALTPALSSVELLKQYGDRMTPEQKDKHLIRIEQSLVRLLSLVEERNESVEQGNILMFRRS